VILSFAPGRGSEGVSLSARSTMVTFEHEFDR
jgi:hypothetical protein